MKWLSLVGLLCSVAALVLALAGCSTPCGTGYALAQPAPAAAPCAAQAAPCAVAAQPVQYVTAQVVAAPCAPSAGPQMVQVMYRTGAGEYARAGLQVPGNLIICAGNFLRCAMDALFPVVQPTAYAVPAVVAAPAPAAAAPCAPPVAAPVCPPAGRWEWVAEPPRAAPPVAPPAGAVPCPPPPVSIAPAPPDWNPPSGSCSGGCCEVP